MSDYADHVVIKQVTIEIPAAQLLSCIWYSDGSGARGFAGVDISEPSTNFKVVSIMELGDRPDIVRITLVPYKEEKR